MPGDASALCDPWSPDDEIARLEAAIAVVERRLAEVRSQEADAHARLRADIPATRALLQEMDRQHAAEVAAIREATETEVRRVLGSAGLGGSAFGPPDVGRR